LLWRDLLHLFDTEVRKAFMAELLGQHYPTDTTAETMHQAFRNLLAPKTSDPMG
jgi:hypothetical protein